MGNHTTNTTAKIISIPICISVVAITAATTIFAKWEDASVVKTQLQTLISEVESAKEGGTEAGINYLQTVIGEAQAIVDNSGSTISDFTTAISNLNTALPVLPVVHSAPFTSVP